MLNETYPGVRHDAVTICADEYRDLIRAQAHLDTMLVLMNEGRVPDCLIKAYSREQGIAKEANHGNGKAVLLDEAERKLHDQRHD